LKVLYVFTIGRGGSKYRMELKVQQGCPTSKARELIANKLGRSISLIKVVRYTRIDEFTKFREKLPYMNSSPHRRQGPYQRKQKFSQNYF